MIFEFPILLHVGISVASVSFWCQQNFGMSLNSHINREIYTNSSQHYHKHEETYHICSTIDLC